MTDKKVCEIHIVEKDLTEQYAQIQISMCELMFADGGKNGLN